MIVFSTYAVDIGLWVHPLDGLINREMERQLRLAKIDVQMLTSSSYGHHDYVIPLGGVLIIACLVTRQWTAEYRIPFPLGLASLAVCPTAELKMDFLEMRLSI